MFKVFNRGQKVQFQNEFQTLPSSLNRISSSNLNGSRRLNSMRNSHFFVNNPELDLEIAKNGASAKINGKMASNLSLSKKYVSCENVRNVEDDYQEVIDIEDDDDDENGLREKLVKRYNSLTTLLMRSFRKAKKKKKEAVLKENDSDSFNQINPPNLNSSSVGQRAQNCNSLNRREICSNESTRINQRLSSIEKRKCENENANEKESDNDEIDDDENEDAIPVFIGVKMISNDFVDANFSLPKIPQNNELTNNSQNYKEPDKQVVESSPNINSNSNKKEVPRSQNSANSSSNNLNLNIINQPIKISTLKMSNLKQLEAQSVDNNNETANTKVDNQSKYNSLRIVDSKTSFKSLNDRVNCDSLNTVKNEIYSSYSSVKGGYPNHFSYSSKKFSDLIKNESIYSNNVNYDSNTKSMGVGADKPTTSKKALNHLNRNVSLLESDYSNNKRPASSNSPIKENQQCLQRSQTKTNYHHRHSQQQQPQQQQQRIPPEIIQKFILHTKPQAPRAPIQHQTTVKDLNYVCLNKTLSKPDCKSLESNHEYSDAQSEPIIKSDLSKVSDLKQKPAVNLKRSKTFTQQLQDMLKDHKIKANNTDSINSDRQRQEMDRNKPLPNTVRQAVDAIDSSLYTSHQIRLKVGQEDSSSKYSLLSNESKINLYSKPDSKSMLNLTEFETEKKIPIPIEKYSKTKLYSEMNFLREKSVKSEDELTEACSSKNSFLKPEYLNKHLSAYFEMDLSSNNKMDEPTIYLNQVKSTLSSSSSVERKSVNEKEIRQNLSKRNSIQTASLNESNIKIQPSNEKTEEVNDEFKELINVLGRQDNQFKKKFFDCLISKLWDTTLPYYEYSLLNKLMTALFGESYHKMSLNDNEVDLKKPTTCADYLNLTNLKDSKLDAENLINLMKTQFDDLKLDTKIEMNNNKSTTDTSGTGATNEDFSVSYLINTLKRRQKIETKNNFSKLTIGVNNLEINNYAKESASDLQENSKIYETIDLDYRNVSDNSIIQYQKQSPKSNLISKLNNNTQNDTPTYEKYKFIDQSNYGSIKYNSNCFDVSISGAAHAANTSCAKNEDNSLSFIKHNKPNQTHDELKTNASLQEQHTTPKPLIYSSPISLNFNFNESKTSKAELNENSSNQTDNQFLSNNNYTKIQAFSSENSNSFTKNQFQAASEHFRSTKLSNEKANQTIQNGKLFNSPNYSSVKQNGVIASFQPSYFLHHSNNNLSASFNGNELYLNNSIKRKVPSPKISSNDNGNTFKEPNKSAISKHKEYQHYMELNIKSGCQPPKPKILNPLNQSNHQVPQQKVNRVRNILEIFKNKTDYPKSFNSSDNIPKSSLRKRDISIVSTLEKTPTYRLINQDSIYTSPKKLNDGKHSSSNICQVIFNTSGASKSSDQSFKPKSSNDENNLTDESKNSAGKYKLSEDSKYEKELFNSIYELAKPFSSTSKKIVPTSMPIKSDLNYNMINNLSTRRAYNFDKKELKQAFY